MAKPDPAQVVRDAHRLKNERFKRRDEALKKRRRQRFGEEQIEVPKAYRKTAMEYHSPAIREEARHLFALIDAFPVPHLTPPQPEDQAQTTAIEKYLSAMHQELESQNGHVWTKARQAQMHDRIGWVKFSLKRDFYAQAPTPPKRKTASALLTYQTDLGGYKREAGSAALWDYTHPPTDTIYLRGSVWNPLAVYEIKDVDEEELILQYGLTRDRNGRLSQPENVSNIAGTRANRPSQTISFIEYWDREWCLQVCETPAFRGATTPLVLDAWQHGFGRVPYFAMPGFETEVADEEKRFEGPLDALYDEQPRHEALVTMDMNVAHLVSFPSWQLVSPVGAEQILDDENKPVTRLEFVPGFFHQNAPGQQVEPLPMAKGNDLARQVQQSFALMQQYSTAAVTRGVSPGADTANSAIAELQRLQRSALDPLLESQAWCARELYRFALKRIAEDIQQTVYAIDPQEGDAFPLDPAQIVTMNCQVKVQPDTGQDALIEEKQAAEMVQMALITPLEFHERRGKENPEEYVRAQLMWEMFTALKPQLLQQVLANLGNTDAIAKMVQANQQTGSARDAVPGIMQDVQNQQQGGVGEGSPGLPRAMGVRSPAVQTTTQPVSGVMPEVTSG